MSRAVRIMELTDQLRANPTTTVDALADALGVSSRTVRRDLATLRARGLSIAGEAGPGGGIRLAGEREGMPVHLSTAEVVTLWLSARLAAAASALPWSGAANSALLKLLGTLPPPRARELRALCRRVIVGGPPTRAMLESAGRAPIELLALFERAFTAGFALGFDYRDRLENSSRRRIEPHGLLVQSPIWYVLAFDLDKLEPRMFRMDRIARPRVLEGVAFRPRYDVIEQLLCDEIAWRPLFGEPRAQRSNGE